MADEPLTAGQVRLTAAEWAGLDKMAKARGVSRSVLLRRMVQRFLAGEAQKQARNEVTPRFKK
jgi:metal-responsive CopG/Arc/MetJ family transcriptional regulator